MTGRGFAIEHILVLQAAMEETRKCRYSERHEHPAEQAVYRRVCRKVEIRISPGQHDHIFGRNPATAGRNFHWQEQVDAHARRLTQCQSPEMV